MRSRSRRARAPSRLVYLHDNVAFGGMETLQIEILRHVDRSRYDPVVFSAGRADSDAWQQFHALLTSADVPLLGSSDAIGVDTDASASALGIARLLRNEQIDVAHIQTRTPSASRKLTLATAVARVPAVVRTEHLSPGPHVGRWTKLGVRPFDWMTDVIMVDSNGDRLEQIELVGRRPAKVIKSYCGIDASQFDPDHSTSEAKVALGLDPTTPVIGTVGRLHVQKGHRVLVAAAAAIVARSVGPVTFLIVGDGPEEANLRAQAEASGVGTNVRFVGFQPEPLVYMQAMDVVAMPSLWEGFSISMQQFMALGKPMVVSDHHSFREAMVDGEHGLIVPTGDDAALADGVLTLLGDVALRRRLGAAASERARREFTIQRHVDELMDIYDRLLDRRSKATRPAA